MALDDVLMDASVAQYAVIKSNWAEYSPYLVDVGYLTPKQIHDRPIYQFNDWLIRKELRDLPKNDYANIQARLIKMLERDFYSKDYHASMAPTAIANGSVLNRKYMMSDSLRRIYVYAPYLEMEHDDKSRKLECIRRNFKDRKVEPLMFPASESLMDAISGKGIQWDLLVTDDAAAVRSIAEKYRTLSKKEFLMPKYGYNAIPKEVKILIEGKGGVITEYDVDQAG
jgi:hypothetical protein